MSTEFTRRGLVELTLADEANTPVYIKSMDIVVIQPLTSPSGLDRKQTRVAVKGAPEFVYVQESAEAVAQKMAETAKDISTKSR